MAISSFVTAFFFQPFQEPEIAALILEAHGHLENSPLNVDGDHIEHNGCGEKICSSR